MRTKVETITPKKAQSILDNHWVKENQRTPSPSVVSSYAREMKSNQWLLTHQGIAIDDAGELIDGVHRLLAVIESGATIDIMVTRDIPHNGSRSGILTIDAIDRNRIRGVGQQISLRHGIKNGALVASVARYILLLCVYSRNLLTGKFSVPTCLTVLDVYGKEIEYSIAHRSTDKRVRNAAVCAACAFALKACPNQIPAFYQQLTTGENLKRGNPALALRRFLMNTPTPGGNSALSEMRMVLSSAMKSVQQEQLIALRDSNQGFEFFLDKQGRAVTELLTKCGYGDKLI